MWLWLFTLLPAFASAATLQGKVVHIADGDTLTVLVDQRLISARTSGTLTTIRRGPFSAGLEQCKRQPHYS